jgi:hypothetical protein
MPELHEFTDDAAGYARDAAYVVVGLGVLGYQRVQVQRVTLERKLAETDLEDRITKMCAAVVEGVRQIDDVLEGALQIVESTLETLEQLPPPASDLAAKAHAGARQVGDRLRELVGTSSDS